MKKKKIISKIKSVVIVATIMALITCTVSGCSFWNRQDAANQHGQAITFEDTQALVDDILDDINKDSTAPEDNAEKTETVNVDSHVAYGDIYTTIINSGTGDANAPFTILEITPYKDFSFLKYLVGGKEPIDCYGLDSAFNQCLGSTEYNEPGILNQHKEILGQNNAELDNFRYKKVYSRGYFEKVSSDYRDGAGGVYALQMETVGNDTIPLLTGKFEKVYDNSGKYRANTDVSADDINSLGDTVMTAGGYKLNDHTMQYFVESENGDYVFKPGTHESGKFRGIYAASEYYTITNSETKIISGYDCGEYEWVWHELESYNEDYWQPEPLFLMKNTPDGEHITSFGIKDLSDLSVSNRIYVDRLPKFKAYNNEIFLLQCMGLDTSGGANGLMKMNESWILDFDSSNLAALNTYYDGNYGTYLDENRLSELNKITINTVTPDEINQNPDYIKTADLIFFNSGDTELMGRVRALYVIEHPNCAELPTTDGEIDFVEDLNASSMLEIYYKVINNDVTIAMDRATLESKQINIKHLGFILFNMDNTQLAFDPDNKIVYSKHAATPYTTSNTEKVEELQGIEGWFSYNFMGRYILADFIQSCLNTDKAYSSYNNGGKVINNADYPKDYYPTDYLVLNENDAVLTSPKNTSASTLDWEHQVFDSNSEMWKQFNNYYANLGFQMRNGKAGGEYAQYANEILYDDNTQIMDYNKTLKYLASAMHNANDRSTTNNNEKLVIGDIEVVGAGYRNGPKRDDTANITYEDSDVWYSIRPSVALDGSNRKYIYLSEIEYSKAGGTGADPSGAGDGLYIYCVVKTKKEISFYDPHENDERLGGNRLISYKNSDNSGDMKFYTAISRNNAAKPDLEGPFTYKNSTINGEEYYVTEYVYHIDSSYFHDFSIPDNRKDNSFKAYIESNPIDGRVYTGEDPFEIVVRDDFDLD